MDRASPEPLALEAADLAAFEANLATYAGASPARRDGWTPFARRLFLEVLSETGRVSLACDYAGLTKQSAYALRNRDPLFAAGWDAACELARAPLADALYEQAVNGVTETITRDGEVVATRHRHDGRLSIAVLHRLDKRCDRAAELGSAHLALVRRWDEWLALVGRGEDQAAQALLQSPPHGQLGQLREGASPIAGVKKPEEIGLSDRCWQTDDGVWMTDFAPPEGFDLYQEGEWGNSDYRRECTPEEAELLDAAEAGAGAQERAEDASLRDAWFALLGKESQHSGAAAAATDGEQAGA